MHIIEMTVITPIGHHEIRYESRVTIVVNDKFKQEILQYLKVDYNITDCKWEINREINIDR
jgi:hypothetical protein